METLRDGRIKIVGRAPRFNTRGGRETGDTKTQFVATVQILCSINLEDYFEIVVDSAVTFSEDAVRGKFFINCVFSEMPALRSIGTVEIEGRYGARASRRAARAFRERPFTSRAADGRRRPRAIHMRCDNVRVYRGCYLPDTKTMIMGNLFYDIHYTAHYIGAFINGLIASHGLTRREPSATATRTIPDRQTKTIHEIHKEGNEFVKKAVELIEPRKRCTVGCDPEFEFMQGNTVVSPPASYMSSRRHDNQIGIDGSGMQLELRPQANVDESVVVQNIARLMSEVSQKISTVGDRYPLGGHIHVGVGGAWSNIDQDLIFLLDYFVGRPAQCLNGRGRGSYAQMGAAREQPWGFEYRSCPSILFDCPDFARLALKAVKNLTECFINEQEFMLSGSAPQWTDYFNYCFFTPQEFMQWASYINQYKGFLRQSNRYERNTRLNWLTREQALNTLTDAAPVTPTVQRTSTIFDEDLYRPTPESAPATPETVRAQDAQEAPQNMRDVIQRINAASRRPRVRGLHFRDDWDASTRERFRLALSPDLWPDESVTLFGLAENRGAVTYGYDAAGWERISGDWDGYGVPFETRVGYGQETEQVHIDGITRAINARRVLREGEAPAPTLPEICVGCRAGTTCSFMNTADQCADAEEREDATRPEICVGCRAGTTCSFMNTADQCADAEEREDATSDL